MFPLFLTVPSMPPEIEEPAIEQVTSVFQISDVRPTDWAFTALQSLVERYGCIAGYPDKTFKGNRSMSRYEFAAGLQACLDTVQSKIQDNTTSIAKQSDLETLKKLTTEFAPELSILSGRIDRLEAKAQTLESNPFSTTVKLSGQTIVGLSTAAGGNPPGLGQTNLNLTYMTQLQLSASFTGRDILRIGVITGNTDREGFGNPESLNTFMAYQSFQAALNNQLRLNTLEYRFAATPKFVIAVQPVGFSLTSVLSPNSSYTSAGEGAVSRFAAFNPMLRIGDLDAGVGFDWLISKHWRLQAAYGARTCESTFTLAALRGTLTDCGVSHGFFNADHSAWGVQLLNKPNNNISIGLAYINAYSSDGQLDTFTGSNNADISGGFNEPANIHALSGTLRWRIMPQVTLGAWGGLAVALSRDSGAATIASTFLFSLGVDDPFGRKGDQFAILAGMPPRLNGGLLIEQFDQVFSWHLETFYRFRINDRISITPGIFYVTNPGHISSNSNLFVSTIRTTFSF